MGYDSFCKCPSVLTLMSRNNTRYPNPAVSKYCLNMLEPAHQRAVYLSHLVDYTQNNATLL